MAQDRRRQKKLEKHRKKRAQKAKSVARHGPGPDLLRTAERAPLEAAYLSKGWRDANPAMPLLVTALLLRRLPSGQLLPVVCLVDRTCLGLKSGFLSRPIFDLQLPSLLQEIGEPHGGLEACEPLVAQSLIFHAVDYARSLGFSPDPDVPLTVLGPRPEVLLDTPLCRPERPIFVSGPYDDAMRVFAVLDRAVGERGYELIDDPAMFLPDLEDDEDLEDEPKDLSPA